MNKTLNSIIFATTLLAGCKAAEQDVQTQDGAAHSSSLSTQVAPAATAVTSIEGKIGVIMPEYGPNGIWLYTVVLEEKDPSKLAPCAVHTNNDTTVVNSFYARFEYAKREGRAVKIEGAKRPDGCVKMGKVYFAVDPQ